MGPAGVVSRGFVVAIPGEAHRSAARIFPARVAALACTSQAESWFLCSILERASRLAPRRLESQWLNGHYGRRLESIRFPAPRA